jgi:hypothetical protein
MSDKKVLNELLDEVINYVDGKQKEAQSENNTEAVKAYFEVYNMLSKKKLAIRE